MDHKLSADYETTGRKTVEALNMNGFKASYCQTVEEALFIHRRHLY